MAKEDDLSVNINLGVELNKDDVANVKSELNNIKGAIEDINNSNLGPGLGSNTGSPFKDIQAAIEDVKKKYKGQNSLELKNILPEILTGGFQKELGDAWKNIKIGKFKPISEKDLMSLEQLGNSVDRISKKLSELEEKDIDYSLGDASYRPPKRNIESREMIKQAQESRGSINIESEIPEVKELKDLVRFFNNVVLGEVSKEDFNKEQKGVPGYIPGVAQLLGMKKTGGIEFDILPKDLLKGIDLEQGFTDELTIEIADSLMDALKEAASGVVLDEEMFNALFDFEVKQKQRLTDPDYQQGGVVISPLVFSQILSMIQKSGLGSMIGGVDPATNFLNNSKFSYEEHTRELTAAQIKRQESRYKATFDASPEAEEAKKYSLLKQDSMITSEAGMIAFANAFSKRSSEEKVKLAEFFKEDVLEKLTDILSKNIEKMAASQKDEAEFSAEFGGRPIQDQYMYDETEREHLKIYDMKDFIDGISKDEQKAGFQIGSVAANLESIFEKYFGENKKYEGNQQFKNQVSDANSFLSKNTIRDWLGTQLRSELSVAKTFMDDKNYLSGYSQVESNIFEKNPELFGEQGNLVINDSLSRVESTLKPLMEDIQNKIDDISFMKKELESELVKVEFDPEIGNAEDVVRYKEQLDEIKKLQKEINELRQEKISLNQTLKDPPLVDFKKLDILQNPMLQALTNPKIISPGLGSENESSVKGVLTKLVTSIEKGKAFTVTPEQFEELVQKFVKDPNMKPPTPREGLSATQKEEALDIIGEAWGEANSRIREAAKKANGGSIEEDSSVKEFKKELQESTKELEGFRLLITGSREFKDTAKMEEALSLAAKEAAGRPITLVHGDARGADRLAEEVAKRILPADTKIEKHPADWSGLGKGAGMARNSEMVKATADLVLAFFVKGIEARGTGDTVKKAEEAGYKVAKFYSDGHEKAFEEAASKAAGGDLISDTLKAYIGKEYKSSGAELKGSLEEFENQKAKNRIEKFFGGSMDHLYAQEVKGGALNPNLDLLKEFLIGLKQDGGRPVGAMDTEYFAAGKDPVTDMAKDSITELGIVVATASGKIVEVLKFLQAPTDMPAFEAIQAKVPDRLNQAKDFAALEKRADVLGIPRSSIGSANDPAKNAQVANENYRRLVAVLDLFAELDIPLTGSNFKTAEANNITKSINYINEFSKKLGLNLPEIKDANLKNVFDPAQSQTKKDFSNVDFAGAKVSSAYQIGEGKVSGSLDTLMNYIAKEHGDWLKQFEPKFAVKQKKNSEDYTFQYNPTGGSGKKADAHVALADAAASAVVVAFFDRFGSQSVKNALTPIATNIELDFRKQAKAITSSAGGGSKGPINNAVASADEPSNRNSSQITNRLLLTAKELNGALDAVVESLVQPKSVLFKRKQEREGLQGPLEQDTIAKQSFVTLKKMTEAEAAEFNKRIAKNEEHLQIITELTLKENELAKSRQELNDLTQGDAAYALGQIKGVKQDRPPTESESAFVKEGGIKRFYEQAKAVAKLKNEVLDLTKAGRESEIQTAQQVVEEMRKGKVTEQLTDNLRKQIDTQINSTQAGKAATNQIKSQMQEQVAAQKAVQKQTQSLMNTWVTSRYALYDVGNFYQSVAQNLIRVSREIFNTSQSYRNFETSFTSVERAMQLTGDAAVDLRDQFIKLSEEFPISFEEISRIATLGAQMGIAADGVVQFTQTVAKFSTITGISADTVAQKFGKIAELADIDATQFENLGSAVAFAGINAVATESEILTLSESIAAVANQSGITAPEIIGIATALASVGVPAEQARGVFTRVFADLDRAASVGGESLANLASVAGMSAEEFAGSWGKEGEANNVFIALLEGLNASDNLTATFDKLNIVETREINTLTRLAKNLDVVRQALGDSNSSFADATFLGDSFGKTADNLDAKIVVFKNNVDSLAAAFSGNLSESLKTLLDVGSGFLKFLKGASDSSIFKLAGFPIAGLIAAGAGFALLASVTAKATAQVYALRVAMINAANSPMVVSGIAGQVKALAGIGSGIIEMRDKVSGINEKGLIEPVDYSNLIAGEKGHVKELLEKRNIYLALGTEMKGTEVAEKAGAKTRIQLARLEAEQFTNEIAKRVAAIKAEEIALDQLVIAEKTATGAQKEMLASKIAEKTVNIENLKNTKLYTTIHAGQVKVIDADTLATYKNTVATKAGTVAEREEAAARAASAKQVNLNSVSAVTGIEKIGSVLSRVVGFASVIGIVITAVDMLYNAFANLNKVDLTLAGGGTESLVEAIKKDTDEVKKGTMEAITTAKIGYTELSSGVDKNAVAINKLTGTQSLAARTMDSATESTNQQTIAIGQNTKVWLANAIAKDEGLQAINFTNVQQNMEALGMNFDDVLRDMVSAANGADVNPLKKVDEEIAVIQEAMRKRMKEIINPNDPNSAYSAMFDQDYQALEDQKKQLEDVKTSLGGIRTAFEAAFGKSTKYDAIFDALGIGKNAILDLSDALAEATSSGTGMEDVLLQVQNAVIEVAGITSEDDLLKIKTSSSIKALLDVVKTMYEAAKAADNLRGVSVTDLQQDRAMAARAGATEAQLKALDSQIKLVRSGTSAAGASAEALKNALTSIESILAGSGGDGGGAGSPEERIRTLTDYANELKNVLQAAFDIRYQKQIGLDAITSSWINITKAAEDAKKAVKSANEEINQTNADREILLYQLSVAERYGDEKRAAVIRAKLAKLDSQLVSQQEQLAEANNAGSKTLTGNSKAAIDNRSQVRDLVTQYNSYLTALANSGMSSEELQTQAAALEQEFLNQGEALGFSRDELSDYTDAFKNDFTTVLKNLPKNITLEVETRPAMRAIDEFVAQATAALSTVGVSSISSGAVATVSQTLAERVQLIKDNLNNPSILEELKKRTGTTGGEYFIYMRAIANYLKNITRPDADSLLALIGLSRGGFVSGPGTSTSDSIPAMLSKGEYVVRASSVGAYGLDFMNALNQQRVGFAPASQAASVNGSSSSSVVYLSPEDRALLRAAVDRPIALYTENSKIAQSANAGNVLLAQRGSN